MTEPTLLDETYSNIITGFIETGQAPHYTELAADLGVSPEEGCQAVNLAFKTRIL